MFSSNTTTKEGFYPILPNEETLKFDQGGSVFNMSLQHPDTIILTYHSNNPMKDTILNQVSRAILQNYPKAIQKEGSNDPRTYFYKLKGNPFVSGWNDFEMGQIFFTGMVADLMQSGCHLLPSTAASSMATVSYLWRMGVTRPLDAVGEVVETLLLCVRFPDQIGLISKSSLSVGGSERDKLLDSVRSTILASWSKGIQREIVDSQGPSASAATPCQSVFFKLKGNPWLINSTLFTADFAEGRLMIGNLVALLTSSEIGCGWTLHGPVRTFAVVAEGRASEGDYLFLRSRKKVQPYQTRSLMISPS